MNVRRETSESRSLVAEPFGGRDWAHLWKDSQEQRDAEIAAERLRDVLAESTAADVKVLRLALARILVEQHGTRSYAMGGCVCADDGKSCLGHVPEATKIARAALGLSELPDRARVAPPEKAPPAKPKRKRKPKPKA